MNMKKRNNTLIIDEGLVNFKYKKGILKYGNKGIK